MNIIEKIKSCKSLSGIIKMINNNNELLNDVINMTKYLNYDVTIHERLFNIKQDIQKISICPICNKYNLMWDHKYKRYKNTCSSKNCKCEFLRINKDHKKEKIRRQKISNTQKNKSIVEKKMITLKIKETNIKKYGVDSYAKTKEFKEHMINKYGYVSPFELKKNRDKSKSTFLKRYGVDHNFKIKHVKENKKKTFLKKYGVDVPSKSKEIIDKIKNTNIKKYGGNSPMCDDKIKQKSKKTYNTNYINNINKMEDLVHRREESMLKKYGVRYWVQDSNNLDKLVKKTSYKKYIFNGDVIYLQGYEDYVLFEILLNKYNIDDIYISNKKIEHNTGKICYIYDSKVHKYYPDFYIKSENKIYEVKSEYTYKLNKIVNDIKRDACIDHGLKFEFLIIDKKVYKKWENKNKNKNNE